MDSRRLLDLSKQIEEIRVEIHDHLLRAGEETAESITNLNDAVTDIKASIKSLASTWTSFFTRWLEEHGDLEGHDAYGEPVRYYVKDDVSYHLKDRTPAGHQVVIEEAMARAEAKGADPNSAREEVLGCLSANAWKWGALRKVLGSTLFFELVDVKRSPDVETGKPKRTIAQENKYTRKS